MHMLNLDAEDIFGCRGHPGEVEHAVLLQDTPRSGALHRMSTQTRSATPVLAQPGKPAVTSNVILESEPSVRLSPLEG